MTALGGSILGLALEVAPWLVAGLAIAGIVKAWVPERKMSRWLDGPGIGPIGRGAVIGAPLPLCSCGAIPAGVALHRGGASRGATTAFMVGTPGIGIDSVALTYALMGPFMAVVRPVSAVLSAVATGVLVAVVPDRFARRGAAPELHSDCCAQAGCASGEDETATTANTGSPARRTARGLGYAFGDVLRDIGPWMVLGIVLAGALATWIPPSALIDYGSGTGAMLVMAVIGIPLYLCAQAATPIAASMILAGVSPGTALVFLLAAPITSLATLAVLRREFGFSPVVVYTASIAACAVAAGLSVDAILSWSSINVVTQIGDTIGLFPAPLEYLALGFLLVIPLSPVQRRLRQLLRAESGS